VSTRQCHNCIHYIASHARPKYGFCDHPKPAGEHLKYESELCYKHEPVPEIPSPSEEGEKACPISM
jgi:hypothetical protein